MMAELSSTIENIGSNDQRGVAEFFVLLGPEQFSTYLAELVEALETGNDPGAFWAKWIDVVVERTPTVDTQAGACARSSWWCSGWRVCACAALVIIDLCDPRLARSEGDGP